MSLKFESNFNDVPMETNGMQIDPPADFVGRHFSGGVDVQLVGPIPDKYVCPFCKKLMKDPVQCLNPPKEGDRACRSCYLEAQWDPNICPISQTRITVPLPYFVDKHAMREILAMECYCVNYANGCPFKGDINQMEKSHLPTCQYEKEICPNDGCTEKVLKKDIDKHISQQCPHRMIKCVYCTKSFKGHSFQIHQFSCDKAPIMCPFKCGNDNIAVCDIASHMLSCPMIVSGKICPYAIVGCQAKPGSEKQLKSHIAECTEHHAALTIGRVSKILMTEKAKSDLFEEERCRCESLSLQMDEQNREIRNLNSSLIDLQEQFNEMKSIVEKEKKVIDLRLNKLETNAGSGSLMGEIERIKLEVGSLSTKHDFLEQKVQQVAMNYVGGTGGGGISSALTNSSELKKLIERVDQMETTNALMSANLSDTDLKLQLLENTSYEGRQVWKVDNIAHRIQQAVTGKYTALHSAPCYSKRFGYKFCTRLYLNGDGLGKGSHVSVFFVVMKGEYDALLPWPFSQRVTFKLINHHDNGSHVNETFLPDRNSSSFQQPKKDMNIAAGCPMFITKDALINGNYIVDDSIFIETTVSPIE